jgi:hypothetical protein
MRRLVTLAPLVLVACSTVPAEGAQAPTRSDAGHVCRDEGLSSFVGRERSSEVGAELLRRSGAKILRWVPKGSMITMEFREDRLTVYLDASNRIERVNCG